MAIDKAKLQEKFKSLSTRYGNGLLQEKELLNQPAVDVFIGLGGLGCRAVNAIKSAADGRLEHPDRRFYLAVDTCEEDMNSIAQVTAKTIENPNDATIKHGCIATDEMLPLFEKSKQYQVKDLDSSIENWINRDVFDDVKIDEKGAQSIRQIGRVMFFGFNNYNRISSKVTQIINTAHQKAQSESISELKIYIIAGISGGTGSGTVVDFSYLVRKIISTLGTPEPKIEGIIFTPDVQENDKGIAGVQAKIDGNRINFYAAFKEIDYFYNNKARKKSYECPIGNHSPAYDEDIFDECTIVSRIAGGKQIAKNSDEIVRTLADALTFEISGISIKDSNGSPQPYSSFYSNVNRYINDWLNTSEGHGMDIPDFLPLRYSSLGYSSFYIPRDELIAYCANRLMERLIDQWNKQNITEDEIKRILRKSSLDSNRSFADKLFYLAKVNESFEVEKNALPKDGAGPLPVKHCKSYLQTMREIGEQEARGNYIRKDIAQAEGFMNNAFIAPIISEVDKAFSDANKGPVYAINLLSAGISNKGYFEYKNTGILIRLVSMIESLASDAKNWQLELEQQFKLLADKAEQYDGKMSIEPGDLEAFTNDCRDYGEGLVKVALLLNAKEHLEEIYAKINDKNNRVFEIYTTTFEFLLATLKKDSEYVTDAQRHRDGHTTIFTFDVANFEENDPKSKRFREFFDKAVDTKSLDEESKIFIKDVFGKLKEEFDPVGADTSKKELTANEDTIIDVLREYFNDTFKDWTNDVVEKFIVVAYSTLDVTPELITNIFKDPTLKQKALKEAATEIETKVFRDSPILLTSVDSARNVENFTNYTCFASLESTPNLNEGFDNSNYLLDKNWSEIIRFKRIFGFPLGFVNHLKEYKKLYDNTTLAGIHLDEVGDNWRVALPEPYSYSVAKSLGEYKNNGQDISENDKQIMNNILELAKKALKYDLFAIEKDPSNIDYYKLTYKLINSVDFLNERQNIYDSIKSILLRNKDNGIEASFIEVINDAGYRTDDPISIQWTFARPEYNVMHNKTDLGDENVFGNLINLIRSNYEWYTHLEEGVTTFEKFYELYQEAIDDLKSGSKYENGINRFVDAIAVGMLTEYSRKPDAPPVGYQLQYSDRKENVVIFDCTGWNKFDKTFSLYLFFVMSFINLDENVDEILSIYLEKYREEGKKEDKSIGDVEKFKKQINTVLNDADLLGQYSETLRKMNFEKALKRAEKTYDIPNPSNGNKDVTAVIKNLYDFYTTIKDALEEL